MITGSALWTRLAGIGVCVCVTHTCVRYI
jgi:hypothetical protein